MIKFKYGYSMLVLINIILLVLYQVNCKNPNIESRERETEVDYFTASNHVNHTRLTLLTEEMVNHVSYTNGVWRWKSRSGALRVNDDIRLQIINSIEIENSFSIEFRVKVKKLSKASIFRALSQNIDGNRVIWLDCLLNYQRANMEVVYLSSRWIPEKTIFELLPEQNTWFSFILTVRSKQESLISLTVKGWPKQERSLASGIALELPQNSQFEIGGESFNADSVFTGFISKGVIYIPAVSSFPATSDARHVVHRKRGAVRKPTSERSARDSRQDSFYSRNETVGSGEQDESLSEQMRSCLAGQQNLSNMLAMVKQSQKELESRIEYLEACECRLPPCVTESGRSYAHNETWTDGECVNCRCHGGVIQCQTDANCRRSPCEDVICRNGGVCIERGSSYTCRCRRGYYGDHCEEIDYCARRICLNGAQCQRLPGSGYTCTCSDGFTGRNCQIRDWCYLSPCLNRGSCINRARNYECHCADGFSGSRCENRDWCFDSPCMNGAECINSEQTYRCVCRPGFVGNRCQYSDLCEANPCGNGGRCENLLDSENYRCDCLDGYTGADCNGVDVCASSPCRNRGVCTANGREYLCRCPSGFVGDRCEIRDHCFGEPCMNGATCSNVRDQFQCGCAPGFYGTLCENRDVCTSDSCRNGGICVPENGRFSCNCRRQFYGDRCQYIDYCRANPCRNNAVCRNEPYDAQQPFTCNCPAGFTGALCQDTDLCDSNPCLNDGICSVQGKSFSCVCGERYRGERCQWIDYCSTSPCLHGGVCRNEERGFVCTCPQTHLGKRCENPHPCRNNPCLNGGKCRSDGAGGYSCLCRDSHFGARCEKVNHCRRNPCLNGGACLNGVTGFTCTCLRGFAGSDCSVRDGCSTNPCLNGGRCRFHSNQTVCDCPASHQGARCEYQCNICMYLPDQGSPCDTRGQSNNRRQQKAWYYDKFAQSCKAMRYTGCGGNSNRFSSRQECRQRCMVGACCTVQLSTSPSYTCRVRSLGQCKRINVERNDLQVLSFKSGRTCSSEECSVTSKCKIGRHRFDSDDTVDMGCRRRCLCMDDGVLDCPCIRASVRKELRQLTREELVRFQQAVRALKTSDVITRESSWDAMRDEYMQRSPLAQTSQYFLLWNRAFLRKMELLLQKVDCRVAIPYFDFTLDSGRFNESIIWQPGYFGGDGECVPDHPFREIRNGRATPWQPCLVRSFEPTVSLPNMVDVALALKSDNLLDLGASLSSIVSYVRAYTGGDMATSACAYDPLFYPLHAYIDYLFAQWQRRNPDTELPPHSSLISLGMPSDSVWSSVCVSYVSLGYLNPCNVSDVTPHRFAEDGFNLLGYNREGFDRHGFDRFGYDALGRNRFGRVDSRQIYIYDGYDAHGYDRAGYDRRGFNNYGFRRGFGRDGYNVAGYDRDGYNRYGFDVNGYDNRGFDIYGVSTRGRPDESDYYDIDTGFSDCCFSRDGLTVAGLDKHGFSAAGYDMYNCNYFFQGPYALYYQHKLWPALSIQPRTFLTTLSRTCGLLSDLPATFMDRNWLSRASRLPILPVAEEANTTFSDRFCYNTEMILTWCPCLEGRYPAVCDVNPCQNASCPLHPDANCHINMCGRYCTAEYILNGRRVNCEDPCRSNPCLNGGSCVPSRYSSAADRFRCDCPDGFSGSLCERQSGDTCALPKLIGTCRGRQLRWYYNQLTRSCEQFTYSGCGGNMNNFPHIRACELRCSVGACCYRRVANVSQLIGFDRHGYDKYGFNQGGYNRKGFHRSPLNSIPLGSQVLGPKGFGHDGYNIYGYDEEGYDRQGYDRQGFHRDTGYNRTGYDKYGRFDGLHEFGIDGLNGSGFSRDGFLCNGLNPDGYNHFGYYKKYVYDCQSLSQLQCDAMSSTHEVVSFSIGRSCEDVHCGDRCGCDYMDKLYKFGQVFEHGCKTCTCSLAGTVSCLCNRLGKRKEIRDLTEEERNSYFTAIRKLYESNRWDYFVNARSEYMPQAHGTYTSLPWHRFFLSKVEGELQKYAGCKVTIPYFDWTIDAGSLNQSYVWSASYFGGDGQPEKKCVRYHPFQSRIEWSPCIQRSFNTSISLPDAVDIQLLLNEPDFKNFSIQLRSVSVLFQLWVGGHMISPFSAYDPLFLSHWAFMDRLWAEWQAKNPGGMPRFPLMHRYAQLKPFDITPDDVISTQQQSCVSYIPPTLGAPCNITMARRPMIRNEDGFDRNGLDEDGFDIEGYNEEGRGRNGEVDDRNIYDENGFTLAGYHRSGFDAQGWDQYGFDRMDRNRDGFDIAGYDTSGYDRYGFDREGKTPFGLYFNGSFHPDANEGYAGSLFDKYGYNRYGFSPFGLNQQGFSAYGFNAKGYDQDNCNYYKEGPHYMRFFFFGLMQLQNLPRDALRRIPRICSPVSPLPEVAVTQWWLGDIDLIRAFEQQWTFNRQIDSNFNPRTSSVTPERLWLPLTPDQQFCFDLHKFTGCPIATPLVECPVNLCRLSRCASHPDAQCRNKNCGSCYSEFFDGNSGEIFTCFGCIDIAGTVHAEASTWDEDCKSCLCQGGTITCTPVMCPTTRCIHPATPTGQCCPSCAGCEYEGATYRNGQLIQNRQCEACQCNRGSVTCGNAIQCPIVRCSNPIRRAGECCLTCPRGCEGHREGERWSLDDCRSCQCMTGLMRCFQRRCPATPCSHPFQPAGQCCPVCSDCDHEGRRVPNRRQFMRDACTQCTCNNGNIVCTARACPTLKCGNQETPVGHCCPVCVPGCQFEGNSYRDGEMFRPSGSPCRNCTCQGNEVVCHGRQCRAARSCPRPSSSGGGCCPQCSDCNYGDRTYRNHQVWTSESGCERCTCENGNVECKTMYICERTCTHGVAIPGQCCAGCTRCNFNSQIYDDGEIFVDERDRCSRCQCSRGSVTCSTIQCPPLRCSSQSRKPGECCPSCSSCRQGSTEREHGSSWRMERDACTTCTCHEGKISCRTESCPPLPCNQPLSNTDACCPICDGCTYNGVNYRNGDNVSTSEPCRQCRCSDGNVACTRQDCDELSCENQVYKPGQCCPSCAPCTYERNQYDEGSTFLSPRNPCLQCTCSSGEVTCDRLDLSCPDTSCSHPGREYGVCCPKCNNCAYERRNYRNGATFTPPGSSSCFVCTCNDGVVECTTDTCEGISCPNPVVSPGKCCPTCKVCVDSGVTHESGDQWSSDPCTTCSCDAGRVVCQTIDCPIRLCSHPARPPNSCCEVCDSCMFSGHLFSHGQRFRHPTERCQVCHCNTGSVVCQRVECDATSCDNPVTRPGDCCPVCIDQCILNGGAVLDNGAKLVPSNDTCQICTCSGGRLQCERRCNYDPPCRHPARGSCCRDNCDGCYYRGKNYYNGEEFAHGRDKCRKCACTNGNVRCIRQRCPPSSCEAPRIDGDVCCPVCPESRSCSIGSRTVQSGRQYQDGCQVCRCEDGDILCRPKTCPRPTCTHPSRSGCCRECTGCTINGIDYRNGETVPSSGRCASCRCLSGDLSCTTRTCPPVSCSHPANQTCCPSCQACLYDGLVRSNGAEFDSAEDPCSKCSCSDGNIVCERKTCPALNCTHPTSPSSSCCPVCGGDCLYEGVVYSDGTSFPHLDDPCRTRACNKGSVTSQANSCPAVSCRNPTSGSCGCSVCDSCTYNGVERRNRETFPSPLDERCSECYCQDGNVNCGRKQCRSSPCTHPSMDTCNCPDCNSCFYHGNIYTNDQEFVDVEDTCNNCICEDGNVVCESRSCSDAQCANPVLDRCGCPVCTKCNYLGVEYDNDQNFIDSANQCRQCVCRFGTVHCAHRSCPPVFCSNPATPFGECCPKCIGTCLVEGRSFENGQTFQAPSDRCSTCTCSSGEVRCVRIRCGSSCSHPATNNQCCPDCTSCSYQGEVLAEGQSVSPRTNPCQHCTCRRGSVVCREMQCPVADCPHPRVPRGECCPECSQGLHQICRGIDGRVRSPGERWIRRSNASCSECSCSSEGEMACVNAVCDDECSHPVPSLSRCCPVCSSCYYKERTYSDGEMFEPNSCQECMCRRGSVQCVTQACKPLSCPLHQQVQPRDGCCPQCVSCSLGERTFAEGQTWTAHDDECITCQCVHGVVTCQPVTCVPACQMMRSDPGRCCPVCPGCRHRGRVYSVGEQFEPNPMNPCEICECIASSDGSPSIYCHQVACPSLADCPRSCIKQPVPGSCCPTCTNRPECSYGDCNVAIRGRQIHPSANPCYTCTCNNNTTWECAPISCPKLDCPQSERYTPKGSCCPICDACHVPDEARKVDNGFAWRVGECSSCHCDHGSIVCMTQECQPLDCRPPMMLHKADGQCCQQCVDPRATCIYEGHSVASRHRWLVDKCTSCQCFAGKITCATQRCRMLMCNSDETATVLPGECCPRCLPTPGTCVAFGDPHYRTFDGRMIHYQGSCRYLLTSDCLKGDFRVEVQNARLGESYGDVTWTDQVYLTVAGHRVSVNSDYAVTINGTTVLPPILVQPYLFIDATTNHILVNTHLGVQLTWNGAQRHLEVRVPGSYKQRTCGLCGNFNNFPQDDLRLRNSRITSSDTTFGNHWKVTRRSLPPCPDSQPYNPCDNLPYSQRKKANNACKVLRSQLFSSCHQVVNPEMYFASCVQDVCSCGENRQFCLCDALETYASQCKRSGVVLSWRSNTLCDITCPTERGYVFDECGSPCKRTCANRNLPPDEIDRQCYLPCVSRCQCVAGKVEHDGRCINPSLCPDHISAVDLHVGR